MSGFYFSHPDSRYFAVGRIERDQVADYAHRKGMDLAAFHRKHRFDAERSADRSGGRTNATTTAQILQAVDRKEA